jgi:D-serine/D-alanine/glycine transporter
MFVWTMILLSYLAYRRRRPQDHALSTFPLPGGRVMPFVVMAFFAFLLWAFTGDPDTLAGMLATPFWFVVIGAGYLLLRRRPEHAAQREAFRARAEQERAEARAWADGTGGPDGR